MTNQFDFENGNKAYYSDIAFNEDPHIYIIFNENKEIIHCNNRALKYFDVMTLEKMNTKFHELSAINQPDGQNSLKTLLLKFDEAEVNAHTEFEFLLPTKDDSLRVYIIIKHIVSKNGNIFIVTGCDLTALKEAEMKKLRQDTYLTAMNSIGEVLMSAEHTTFDNSLAKVTDIIGQAFDASYVSVCSLTAEDGTSNCLNLCTWQRESFEDSKTEFHIPEVWIKNLSRDNLLHKIAVRN